MPRRSPAASASVTSASGAANESAARASLQTLGAWLSGMCLLEPCVGVLWQRSFASHLGQPLDVSRSLLLACPLWLVYTLDHWLDVRRAPQAAASSQRHAFVATHQGTLEMAWLLVLSFCTFLAARVLTPDEWLCAGLLLLSTIAYFVVVHSGRSRILPKELLVAVIFSAGISFFNWPTLTTWSLSAALALVSFSTLALLNVAIISVAERRADAALGEPTLALDHPSLERWVTPSCVGLTSLAVVSLTLGSNFADWQLSVALSALGLAALGRHCTHLEPNQVHRLADAALLIPLAVLLW